MKFCIVGTGRCGTTLLWRMLNAHPDLFVHRETHWLPLLHEAFGTRCVATDALLDIVLRTCHVTGDPVMAFDADAFRAHPLWKGEMYVAEFYDALSRFLAAQSGKEHWADKTPDYGYFTSQLQLYWPGLPIIHLIRDGVQTARSMSRHIGYQGLASLGRTYWCSAALDFTPPEGGFDTMPPVAFADLWHDRLRRIQDEAPRLAPGSYLEIRHEDMLADPGTGLCRIADFVGLDKDPAWLSAAPALIKAGRGKPRAPDTPPPDWFGARHRQLLEELGYPI